MRREPEEPEHFGTPSYPRGGDAITKREAVVNLEETLEGEMIKLEDSKSWVTWKNMLMKAMLSDKEIYTVAMYTCTAKSSY